MNESATLLSWLTACELLRSSGRSYNGGWNVKEKQFYLAGFVQRSIQMLQIPNLMELQFRPIANEG